MWNNLYYLRRHGRRATRRRENSNWKYGTCTICGITTTAGDDFSSMIQCRIIIPILHLIMVQSLNLKWEYMCTWPVKWGDYLSKMVYNKMPWYVLQSSQRMYTIAQEPLSSPQPLTSCTTQPWSVYFLIVNIPMTIILLIRHRLTEKGKREGLVPATVTAQASPQSWQVVLPNLYFVLILLKRIATFFGDS